MNAYRDKLLAAEKRATARKVRKEKQTVAKEIKGTMPFNEIRIRIGATFELIFVLNGKELLSVPFSLAAGEVFNFNAITGDLHYKLTTT